MTDETIIWDPRGLIREAYRIEGITEPDCRSIFLDWALGLKDGQEAAAGARALLDLHGAASDHPMTVVLRAALDEGTRPRRRGGASGRR